MPHLCDSRTLLLLAVFIRVYVFLFREVLHQRHHGKSAVTRYFEERNRERCKPNLLDRVQSVDLCESGWVSMYVCGPLILAHTSPNVCTFVCVYTYVFMYVCVCIITHVCVCIYMYVYTYILKKSTCVDMQWST